MYYCIEESSLKSIANSIRKMTYVQSNINLNDMPELIRSIVYDATDIIEYINGTLSNVYGKNVTIPSLYFAHMDTILTASCACTTIRDSAFYYCTSLIDANFPVCTTIDSYAFANCSSLSVVSFPACTAIGSSAFTFCSSLSVVSFPACTTINSGAFYYCTSLKSIYFLPPSIPSIKSSVFYNIHPSASIYVPESLVEAYKSAPGWSYYSSRITAYIPSS